MIHLTTEHYKLAYLFNEVDQCEAVFILSPEGDDELAAVTASGEWEIVEMVDIVGDATQFPCDRLLFEA